MCAWRSIYFQACVPRQECVRYDFRSFSLFFDRVQFDTASLDYHRALYGPSRSSLLPLLLLSATLLAIIHFLLYHDFRMLVFSLRPDAALASEPNRFISDLSFGLRNNSRKSILISGSWKTSLSLNFVFLYRILKKSLILCDTILYLSVSS